jgi:circadian clock protein KaiC
MRATEQIGTDIDGLDQLMRGGLRRGGLHLVVGEPGAGKTVLAHQIGAARARAGGSVLYLTAMVESHQTLLSQARTFSFFDPSIVSQSFYYASLLANFEASGFDGIEDDLSRQLRERRPDLVVIDGLHGLQSLAADTAEYLRFLTYLQAQAASTGVTLLLISNREGEDAADPMYTISDAIIELESRTIGQRRILGIEVRKFRGGRHLRGSHVFEITADGLQIFPRLEAVVADRPPAETPHVGTVRFGIDGFDTMLGDGITTGSVTLVAGSTGAGKTVFGLSFLAAGSEPGEDGLFLGFHETPARLLEKADMLGLPLRAAVENGSATIRWHPSAELPVDRVASEVLIAVQDTGVRRVVVDGLDDLVRGLGESERAIGLLTAFTDLLRSHGVTTVITTELRQLFDLDLQLPLPEISSAVDNLVLLRHVELGSRLRRYVSVVKVRDQDHQPLLREFAITSSGIVVAPELDPGENPGNGCARLRTDEGQA